MKKSLCLLIIAISLLFTSCATIMTGTDQKLSFNSNVPNAKVYIDGQYRGTTPIILSLKTKDSHDIRIEAPGFAPYSNVIQKKVTGWVWGNILFGGIIGVGIDVITGGLYVFNQDNITGSLVKVPVGQLKRK